MSRFPSRWRLFAGGLAMMLLAGCDAPEHNGTDAPRPPTADRRPHVVIAPGGHRNDPYFWIRDDRRDDPDVLALLKAENEYATAMMDHLGELKTELIAEMKARMPDEQTGAPFFDDGYWYDQRYVDGGEFPVLVRRRGRLDAFEQVLLDGNVMARESGIFRIGSWDVSPDGRRLLWLQERTGRPQFQLMIKDLVTGRVSDTGIAGVASASWAADGRHLVYVENDPVTLRPYRVHRLDTLRRQTELLHEETDPAYSASVGRSRSDRYTLVSLHSWGSTETRFIDATARAVSLEVFLARRPGHEYTAEHVGNHWIIRTNLDAPNFRIMRAEPGVHADPERWTELLPHRDDTLLHEFDPFESFVAVAERFEGRRRIRILDQRHGEQELLEFDEDVHVVQLGRNPESDRRALQFVYTSPTTPQTTWELDLETRERRLLNRLDVGGEFDSSAYRVRRIRAESRDGQSIPVTMVWHRDTRLDGSAPLYQLGYGAYGTSLEPGFSAELLSLLDRGMIYAIAHVRGGQERGRDWYDQGRMLNKHNSFHDFIDVTRHLVDAGLVDRERVFAVGRSAGGLLVGAVANMAPDDYAGIVAAVPFVDVVTTMLDESIPLTTFEFVEWGNPKEPAHYDHMLSYSPYDNVQARDYPAMLVTAGLWDAQVPYWEPVKWVARLRHRRTDDRPLLLKVDMHAGHGGPAGRFQRLQAAAMEYAFVLDLAGLGR